LGEEHRKENRGKPVEEAAVDDRLAENVQEVHAAKKSHQTPNPLGIAQSDSHLHNSLRRWNPVVSLVQEIPASSQHTIFKVLHDVDTFSIAFVEFLLDLVQLCSNDESVFVVKVPLIVGVILNHFLTLRNALMDLPQSEKNQENQFRARLARLKSALHRLEAQAEQQDVNDDSWNPVEEKRPQFVDPKVFCHRSSRVPQDLVDRIFFHDFSTHHHDVFPFHADFLSAGEVDDVLLCVSRRRSPNVSLRQN
jgi:hypothetical protein